MLSDARARLYFRLSGAAFLTTYLDYFLVPLFALFLLVAVYGWRRGGQFRKRG